MIVGALLGIAWLILLIRYPARALPVSLGALAALGLVAGWVLWEEHRLAQRLARVEIRLVHALDQCDVAHPLRVTLVNHNDVPLRSLQWQVTAHRPGDPLDLARRAFDAPRYEGPGDLQPNAEWQGCLPLPALRPGYRPQTLVFDARDVEGRFAD